MKTVFIAISQALLIRNILRSGGFDLLKKQGYRLIIFVQCKEIPAYLHEEFGGDNVELIAVAEIPIKRVHRWFITFTHFLIWNKTTQRYFKYSKRYVDKSRFVTFCCILFLRLCSKFPVLKPMARNVEAHYFLEKNAMVAQYFDIYKPDLMFSTSITSKLDMPFLKEAHRRGIPTVSMPKSWDNVTKMYFRFVPDYFIVQNEYLRDRLITLQDVPAERIYVVGFPQFDWYSRPEILRSRDEHCKKMGLDPKLPIILFGSQGSWYDHDYEIAEKMYEWVEKDELVKPCQMLVRPHFTNVKKTPFLRFKHRAKAAYDDSYEVSNVFLDNWDPKVPEVIDFVNTIYHSDVMVIILSTLALDGACMDKPIINALFGAKYRKGVDITPYMPYTEHYTWVLDTKGTSLAHSYDELKQEINEYLLDSSVKKAERERLRDTVCYKVDGKSSARMVEALEDVMRRGTHNKK